VSDAAAKPPGVAPRAEVRAQRLVARFLADPAIEDAVRADPRGEAHAHGVPEELALKLARIDPARVRAFRASQVHKDRVRQRGQTRPG
jgi:hypothetical protein